ncbi:ATP-binding protein [Botrimarina hoheduenensis]|uniref:histidine kinase n=1 Tax=Botrimarina hoheduenensis TaxID=2528000 RepID=A0A5C5W8Z6_9BACT|nr:ATP-binding protein [Botrimarina hoheduenensis]TWT46743.1 Sensor histidine kinase RegB [Botrimarina hoheduenensis]
MLTKNTPADRIAINADWFATLRWVAAIGQLMTIGFVTLVLGMPAPKAELLLLVAVTVVSNAVFAWWRSRQDDLITSERVWHTALGGLMLLDIVVLTAMLALTGGPTNPFVVFYFVNLALSAMVLPPRGAWALNLLAIVSFGLLIYQHAPIEQLRDPRRLESLVALRAIEPSAWPPWASIGSWVAFATCSTVILSFLTRLNAELRLSNRLRRRAESERARAEKLEALGTLAAGAAHELATPLSTIAVATTEAQRQLERQGGPDTVLDDLRLVGRELARCRAILDRMATDSGQPTASAPEPFTADALLQEVLRELAAADRVQVAWRKGADSLRLLAPRTALAQAIRAVVQNAVDATEGHAPGAPVVIQGDRLAETLRLSIRDQGPGMTPEVLSRAGEPFYTTKAPGHGMGLGLFLARSVVEKLGGSLRLESPGEGGANVTIVLPLLAGTPDADISARR